MIQTLLYDLLLIVGGFCIGYLWIKIFPKGIGFEKAIMGKHYKNL